MVYFNKKMFMLALSLLCFPGLQGMNEGVVDEAEVEARRDEMLCALMEEHTRAFPEDHVQRQQLGNHIWVVGDDISEEYCEDMFPGPEYEAAKDDLFNSGKSLVLVSAFHQYGLLGRKIFNERYSARYAKAEKLTTMLGKVRINLRKNARGTVNPVFCGFIDD